MYTLTTAQIFSNLSFYQENYLDILQSSEAYFTQVKDAFIDIQPFKKRSLYLGDLLKLWFAEKWTIQLAQHFNVEEYLAALDVIHQKDQRGYIFSIQANLLTGSNQTQVWLADHHQSKSIVLDSVLKNYCEYLNCDRPKDQFKKNLNPKLA